MFDQTVLKGSCNQHAPEENVASPPRFCHFAALVRVPH